MLCPVRRGNGVDGLGRVSMPVIVFTLPVSLDKRFTEGLTLHRAG